MSVENHQFKTWYALSLAFQLGFLIAAPILGFILLGLYLDRTYQLFPLFLILGIILGLATTFYEVFHFVSPLIKKND